MYTLGVARIRVKREIAETEFHKADKNPENANNFPKTLRPSRGYYNGYAVGSLQTGAGHSNDGRKAC